MSASARGSRGFAGPMQFISIGDDGKCHLQEEAMHLLTGLQGKLAVVGVAGLYRTGKSFILNRLLGQQEGFEIGPSVNPCTKGIWIWGQPMRLASGYHCIFLDTEGLGSTQRTQSCDMQILSLCLLLSSSFIYNSMGVIDEVAIDELHLVLNLSKHIHAGAGPGSGLDESAMELAKYFPSFMWVLRDFHVSMDKRGEAMSSKDYLERALQGVPGQERHNELRKSIRMLFPERDCVTLVRPVTEEADLQNLNRVPYEKLRPQFRTQVEDFTNKVYTSLKPKTIDGAGVNGRMFVNLATEYCKAINTSSVPVIQSTWAYLVQSQLRECLKEAVLVYSRVMKERAVQCLPLSDEELREVHKLAKAEALEVFAVANLQDSDPLFQQHKADFKARTKQALERVSALNNEKRQEQCQAWADDLFCRLIEQKLRQGLFKGPQDLLEEWERLQQQFVEKTCEGPAQVDVLCNVLFPRLRKCLQHLAEVKLDRNRACSISAMLPWSGR